MLKTVQCTTVRQQWLVAGWLGPSVTVRVKVTVRARGVFLLSLFSSSFFSKSEILVYGACTPREDPGTSVGNTGHPCIWTHCTCV